MSIRLLLMILGSVCLSSVAQLVLKVGITAARGDQSRGPLVELTALLLSPVVMVGLALYGVAALVWLLVLARAPLSLAYPFVGLGFIVTMLFGYFVLAETASPARTIGTLLIATGCVLVARSAAA